MELRQKTNKYNLLRSDRAGKCLGNSVAGRNRELELVLASLWRTKVSSE